jgi:hypothetical protein
MPGGGSIRLPGPVPAKTLTRWLKVRDLEDLKGNLVITVLFLREAAPWEGYRAILKFGAALALIIAVLTFYLAKKAERRD